MRRPFLLLSLTAMLGACPLTESHSHAEKTALRWADAYFHGDYQDAADYVTTESMPLLRLLASNMTQADVEALEQLSTVVELTGYEALNDTLGVATVSVSDYLQPDSIGRRGSIHARGQFRMNMVLRQGDWKVRMEDLPRSGKQSRD